jgi:hypothetical protein
LEILEQLRSGFQNLDALLLAQKNMAEENTFPTRKLDLIKTLTYTRD